MYFIHIFFISQAIVLKLPLRLSFKRTPASSPVKNFPNGTSTSAPVDHISANFIQIESVASLQYSNSETAISTDRNVIADPASIVRNDDLNPEVSIASDKQSYDSDGTPSISIPIHFSLVEEQTDLTSRNNDSVENLSCTENPWSNYYTNTAEEDAQVKTPTETSPVKKFKKTDYTVNMEKSGDLTVQPDILKVFGKFLPEKNLKQLSFRPDGSLFLNWKNSNSC